MQVLYLSTLILMVLYYFSMKGGTIVIVYIPQDHGKAYHFSREQRDVAETIDNPIVF